MALNLPSLKPKPPTTDLLEFTVDGSGLENISGYSTGARSQIAKHHPIEHALKNNALHQEAFEQSIMLRAQGPAGPMIHAMELRATSSVGHLPFLPSSNFQRDVLTGRDEDIDFEDVFGLMPQCIERVAHPHTVMDTVKFRSF